MSRRVVIRASEGGLFVSGVRGRQLLIALDACMNAHPDLATRDVFEAAADIAAALREHFAILGRDVST